MSVELEHDVAALRSHLNDLIEEVGNATQRTTNAVLRAQIILKGIFIVGCM
jgi:hypothetical protein